jgi:predicted nicotinamide N-methyase
VASGSGLVAIAAAKAGARSVLAGDIDPCALAAIELNAAANAVPVVTSARVDLAAGLPPGPRRPAAPGNSAAPDVVLAGDVFYQRELAVVALRFLRAAHDAGAEVLAADPGRAYIPRAELTVAASYLVPVLETLEDGAEKLVTVYRLR